MKQGKDNCPKSDAWFASGGGCGLAHECEECIENPPANTNEQLTKEDCFRILDTYKRWNLGNTSLSLASSGVRTAEDDVLDARRELLRKAYKRLIELLDQKEM